MSDSSSSSATIDPEAVKEILRIDNLSKRAHSVFEVLGITDWQSATTKTVKTEYNKKVLLTHPDKVKHPKAADAFALITRAYKKLVNEALLKMAKKAEEAKHGIASSAASSSAAASGTSTAALSEEEKKKIRQQEEEKMKEALREEYMTAVRAQEQAERRRQREEEELAEKEKEKEDIYRHASDWKKFSRGGVSDGPGAGLGGRRL